MHIGYAPTYAADQHFNQQPRALDVAGCERIVSNKAVRDQAGGEGLRDALSHPWPGEKFVGFNLDWPGRTLRQLIKLTEAPRRGDVGCRSLTDGIGAGKPSCGLFPQTMTALSKMERPLAPKRRRVVRSVAGARGCNGFRHPKHSAHLVKQAKRLLANGTTNLFEFGANVAVTRSIQQRDLKNAPTSRAG